MSNISFSFGGVTLGKVDISNPTLGEGYCGSHTYITSGSWDAISLDNPSCGNRRGYSSFTHTARGIPGQYTIAMFSDGVSIALNGYEYKTVKTQGPYATKWATGDDAVRPEFDFTLCCSLNAVNIDGVTVVGTAGNDLFLGDDGKYYRHDGSVINVPSGVTISSEPFQGIYLGSDGKYYNSDGEVFSNLPSGVIPTTQYGDFYMGSDGNLYNLGGNEVFENIPSDIYYADESIGEAFLFTDGNYYKIDGDEAFTELPQGVDIVSYDSEHNNYLGSDGEKYDIDGNLTSDCNGDLLLSSNTVRITIDCEDIFGNQVNLGGDITIGTNVISIPQATLIRKINRVVARNIDNGHSVGNGNIGLFGMIVGAKIGLDWEGVDIDGVLGNYNVANCVFRVCDRYADIVYNADLPLGVAPLTALDVGYYCLADEITVTWSGFDSSIFPYCCEDYDDDIKSGGELGKTDGKIEVSDDCICEALDTINLTLSDKLDLIADKIDNLLCICEKLDGLINAINSKDFSITVQPPVNQVTVQPPVNQVTVQPPVNNNNITVTPCEPTIQNVINEGDVNVDNEDLIEKLDELFNTTGDNKKNITDVINEKEIETYNDITIESQDWAYCAKGRFEFTDVNPVVSNP